MLWEEHIEASALSKPSSPSRCRAGWLSCKGFKGGGTGIAVSLSLRPLYKCTIKAYTCEEMIYDICTDEIMYDTINRLNTLSL